MSGRKNRKGKRLRCYQATTAEADDAVADEATKELYRRIEMGETTAAAVEDEIAATKAAVQSASADNRSDPGRKSAKVAAYVAAFRHLTLTLQRAQDAFLEDCRLKLVARSRYLSSRTCWSFLEETVQTALRFGVADTVLQLVHDAADRFTYGRVLQLTRCHRRDRATD
jgi:hypothetical protein